MRELEEGGKVGMGYRVLETCLGVVNIQCSIQMLYYRTVHLIPV